MTAGFDLLGVGHPSVDLMFSGLDTWPELGRDIDAGGLGVSAGTSFNTPAAANRLGLRVDPVAGRRDGERNRVDARVLLPEQQDRQCDRRPQSDAAQGCDRETRPQNRASCDRTVGQRYLFSTSSAGRHPAE